MRLRGSNCGCADRKEIIFTQGQLGVPEATVFIVTCILLVAAYKTKGTA